MSPSSTSWEMSGATPWYRNPPAWIGAGTKSCPSVCIATSGVSLLVSPKSYAKTPRVSVGHAAGSHASTSISRPAIFSRRNGNARPAKFEPPPTQPMTTSGNSPVSSIWALASSPITVWCRRTWFRTEPSEYLIAPPDVGGHLDRLADRDAQRTGGVGVRLEDRLPGLGRRRRRRDHLRAERLHEDAAVRLLLVRRLHHEDLTVDPEEPARHRQRRAPLAGSGLRGQPLGAGLLVVEGLRHGGVRLVAPRPRDPLVLEVDPRRGLERLLQSGRAMQRRGAPEVGP